MERLVQVASAAGFALASIGCGDGGETAPDPSDGGGGSAPLECVFEDSFDPAECPASYPEWDCVVYVDRDVAASGDGWSWQSAVETVQEGIDLARCGALNAGVCEQWQVWVKQGLYFVHQGCREHTVRLRPNVGVYGGFTGSESTLDERDWLANETILDGRDGPDGNSHAYHVVIGSDDAVIDGFTVQWGRADHPDDVLLRHGAGLGNVAASPTVDNCLFRHNVAVQTGGAMENYDGSAPSVSGCRFVQNEAGEMGGGVFNAAGSSATISSTTFVANRAEAHGGAISAWDGGSLTITDCVFRENVSGAHGGGLFRSEGTLTISGSTFVANEAHDQGGAIDVGEAPTTITDSVFHANVAHHGGAMRAWGASASATDCTFTDNAAVTTELGDGSGGALKFGGGGEGVVQDCFFSGNTASGAGGAMIVEAEEGVSVSGSTFNTNVSDGHGGAIGMWNGQLSIDSSQFTKNIAEARGGGLMMGTGTTADVQNSTFFDNSASLGGAIEAHSSGPLSLLHCTIAHNVATNSGSAISGAADLTVTNSIIWGPFSSLIADPDIAAATISYSDVPGGAQLGNGNISATPTFVGPGRGDLHLLEDSECINAADGAAATTTDLDGSSRVGAPDMGAYEFQPTN